ncbi:MAG: cytochrome c-type biogenesis protein [Hyphomicrobium sp.]|jgi:cytochrome c-type biogenesis protein CcmH
MLIALVVPALAVASLDVRAVQPDEILPDSTLEHRARELSAGFRCLVCQNQSIDDSDAPLARDLRLLVRERLKAGDNDAEVKDYIVARYGEFVLLQPRLSPHTLLLWLTPFLVLSVAAWMLWRGMSGARLSSSRSAPAKALTAEEQAKLDAVLRQSATPDDRA